MAHPARVEHSRSERIPGTLKAVFLAANRGFNVPPPERVVSETSSSGNPVCGNEKELEPMHLCTRAVEPSTLSPQDFLDGMIQSRGYSTRCFKALQSAYYNKPTSLQQASYGIHLIELVRTSDCQSLDTLIKSGLSPNPCNTFGESLVHMVCRRGLDPLLAVLIENGCSLQVADDYGRTPLHDACWATKPAFGVVDMILQKDLHLFHIKDVRGALPLSYVRREHWAAWIEYFQSKMNVYWPIREDGEQEPPPLTLLAPNTCPIPDPKDALTMELTGMIASGRIKPAEAKLLHYYNNDGEVTHELTYNESDFFEEEDDYDSDEDYSDDMFDEDEMAEILTNLSCLRAKPLSWSS